MSESRIALLSDVHLEAKFASLPRDAARRRRENIRRALERAVHEAKKAGVAALLVGGDLYEQEAYSPDTAEFCRRIFEEAAPLPVLMAPGNHDWWSPHSMYATVKWSPNVHVYKEPTLDPYELEDGLYVWGFAHLGSATDRNPFEGFRCPKEGVHLALVHGSEVSRFAQEQIYDETKRQHAPFREEDVERAGIAHVFAGHYHRPSHTRLCTYPGNPEPLTLGERRDQAPRGLVIAQVGEDGAVQLERTVDVSVSLVVEEEFDVSGFGDRSALEDALYQGIVKRVEPARRSQAFVRIELVGATSPSLDLSEIEETLSARIGWAAAVEVSTARLRSSFDVAALREEQSVRGEFVRLVLGDSKLDESMKEEVLEAGLRALEEG